MDHSNTNQSNSNQPNNQHKPQDNNAETSQQAPQPSKPFKIKGKFTPKSQPTAIPAGSKPIPPTGYPYGASSAQGDSLGNGHSQNPESIPPFYGAPPAPPQSGKLKHSGLGITSFIMSIVALLTIVIGFIVMLSSIFNVSEADLLMLQDPAEIERMLLSSDSMPSFIVSVLIGGILMMGSAFVSFIGFILGVISLFIKQRRKVFGILGTIFNGLICFGGLIFLLISFISTFSL